MRSYNYAATIIALLLVALVLMASMSVYQGNVIDQQETIIRQLMAPEPTLVLPPSIPKGIEPPVRKLLDTPAPKEQNFI